MASGAVRGITIDFNANTDGLKNGIKDIEKESTALQKQITTLNKSLKFDGGNVELVAQKMEYLQKAAAASASEVEDLKKVQDQMDSEKVDRASDAYRKVEQEISILQSKTKGYQAQYEKAMDAAPLEALQRQYTLLEEDIAASDKEVEKLTEQQAKMDAEGVDKTSAEYVALQQKIEAARSKNTQLKEDLQKLNDNIDLKKADGQIEDLGDEMDDAGEKAEGFGDKTEDLQSGLNDLYGVLAAAGLTQAVKELAGAFKECIDTSATFEATMSKVQALSGATGDDFENLSEKAKELGANTKFTASEAADAFSYMALAGWDASDMLDGIDGVLNLAAAAEMDLGEASDIVTDYLTAFGWAAEDSGKFVDEMAYAMANSNTNVSQLGEAYKAVAATASSMGYSVEDTTAAIMVMSNAGLKGSEAGTALNAIMTRLATNTKDCADQLGKYGVQIYDDQDNMRSLSDILSDMSSIWGDLGDEEQAALAKTVAGTSHYSALQTVMAGCAQSAEDGSSSFLDYADALENCDGSAEDMAETMQDNLAGSFTKLESATDGLKNEIGSQLTPAIQGITDLGTEVVSGITGVLEKCPALVPVITGVATALGGLTTATALLIAKEKILAALKAEEAFTNMLTPIGLASVAIGALAAAYVVASQDISDSEQAWNDFSDSVSEASDSYNEKKQALEDNYSTNQNLAASLSELMGIEEKTPDVIAQIKEIVDQLNESNDGLNLSYDEQTDSLNQSISTIDDYIDKLYEEEKAEEIVERMVEIRNEQAEAESGLADAEKELADAQANLDTFWGDTFAQNNADVNEAAGVVNGYKDTIASLGEEYDSLEEEYADIQESLGDYEDTTGDAVDANGDLADSAEDAADELTDEEKAAQDAHDAIVDVGRACTEATGSGDELMEEYEDLAKTFEDNAENCDYATKAYVENMLAQLKLEATTKQLAEQMPLVSESAAGLANALVESGYSVDDFVSSFNSALDLMVSGFDELEVNTENTLQKWIDSMNQRTQIESAWNDNISVLTECATNAATHPYLAADPAFQQAIQTMMEGGVEEYGQAAADLTAAIEAGNWDLVYELINGVNNAGDQALAAAQNEFMLANNLTQEQFQALCDNGTVTIEDGTVQWADAMATGASDAATAVSDESSTVEDAADELVSTAADTFLDSSTNLAWTNGGKALGQYVVAGIKAKVAAITAAAKSAISTAASNSTGTAKSKGSSVGYWFDVGFANAVTNNESLITDAAKAAAQAAYEAAKEELGISSPSTVAYELGDFFDQGLANGIKNGADLIKHASEQMALSAGIGTQSGLQTATNTYNTTNSPSYEIVINAQAGMDANTIANAVMSKINGTLARSKGAH